nr:MAG TPA_asm: hypothetical protein [Caudoviricetes sp.]
MRRLPGGRPKRPNKNRGLTFRQPSAVFVQFAYCDAAARLLQWP